MCVYMCMWKGHSFHNVIFMCCNNTICASVYDMEGNIYFTSLQPPQSVDDLPVVSDKGRARGEHGVKNAVKIHQLN